MHLFLFADSMTSLPTRMLFDKVGQQTKICNVDYFSKVWMWWSHRSQGCNLMKLVSKPKFAMLNIFLRCGCNGFIVHKDAIRRSWTANQNLQCRSLIFDVDVMISLFIRMPFDEVCHETKICDDAFVFLQSGFNSVLFLVEVHRWPVYREVLSFLVGRNSVSFSWKFINIRQRYNFLVVLNFYIIEKIWFHCCRCCNFLIMFSESKIEMLQYSSDWIL